MSQEYNFFEELLKNISGVNEKNVVNTCLITSENLVEPIIKLECGHKFNYKPLKREIIQQKLHINVNDAYKLTEKQIKCPYCRHVQCKLLPYFENEEKMVGVNYPEKYCMKLNNCEYIFKSGKRRNKRCNRECNMNMCKQHLKIKNSKIEKIKNLEKKKYCKAIVKSGVRAKNMGKNAHCLNACKKNGYCMLHYKFYFI